MIRKLGFIILSLNILCVVWICWKIVLPPPKNYIASDYTKQRMKFHGIHTATCEGDVCYFHRNGKRHKL